MDLAELGVEPDEVRRGDYYRTYVVGNVSVAELDDHRIFDEEADEIRRDFVDKLRENPHVDATVDLVSMEKAAGNRLLDTVEAAVREAKGYGLKRYAIVSEDITKYAMKSKVDIDGIETFTSDDPHEALDWAMD